MGAKSIIAMHQYLCSASRHYLKRPLLQHTDVMVEVNFAGQSSSLSFHFVLHLPNTLLDYGKVSVLKGVIITLCMCMNNAQHGVSDMSP